MTDQSALPMPVPPTTKGWCPTAYTPMPTGDGLLGRVKPPLGEVSAAAARSIAAAATRYGSGRLELTNRGGIQIRGIAPEGTAGFAAAIVDAGLASADAGGERRRNVLLTPFAQAREIAVAAAIERWLEETGELAALPPKLGFAVDSARSPSPPLGADIRCVAQDDGWRIELDGGSAATLTTTPAAALARLTAAVLALAQRAAAPPQRMRNLVARVGAQAILAQAGLAATQEPAQPRPAACPLVGWSGEATESFGLGAPFGSIDASTLLAAAALAERHGAGVLRTTPWRALQIPKVAAGEAPRLAAAAAQAGFIVAPDDPRLSIVACPGRPACASAYAPTRTDAEDLARLRPAWLAAGVHVSGCSKGCARPAAAATTLSAGPQGYDLIRHGRAADTPILRGLSLAEAIHYLTDNLPAHS